MSKIKNQSTGTARRPTGTALIGSYARASIERIEKLKLGGKATRLSLLEITVRQLLMNAVRGDAKAMKRLLRLVKMAEKWETARPRKIVFKLHGPDRFV